MLQDNIYECVMWAHRYCIDYQRQNTREVTYNFLCEMRNVIPFLALSQIEHLLVDVERHITESERLGCTYPEEFPSPEMYLYRNLLKDSRGTENKRTLKKPAKFIIWASRYCITRRSYAAGFGTDVAKLLGYLSDDEQKDLLRVITEYIDWTEQQYLTYDEEMRKYADRVDTSWHDIRSYLEAVHFGKLYRVTVCSDTGEQNEPVICFINKEGRYMPVDRYLGTPYQRWYISPDVNIMVEQYERDI